MHSNYGGGVSEMQQFMMDGCPSSLFSISTSPPPPPPPQNSNSGTSEVQKFHPLQHHLQQPLPPPMPQHFAHFGQPIPITQQLFQQSHHHHVHQHHQFQLFQQQQQQQHMGLDQESGPENSNSPARMMGGGGGGPSFLAAMNFKLGVNESSGGGGGGSRDGINEDEGILQGDDDGSESRLHHHHHQDRQPWHREEESAANIKEPFWRPLDIDFINPNNKRPAKDKQPAAATTAEISSSSSIKHFKKSSDVSGCAAATDSNYKLFSELEAIYKPGGGGGGAGGGGGETNNNNQTGSGSALTGDDNPLVPVTAPGPAAEHGQTDNVSDTSNADGAPQKKAQRDESCSGDAAARRKRGRKRRQQKQLGSIATFFESLVKQLMDHQESLHRKFLDVMEKKDQERGAREDACRKQEAAKAGREAAARAQERALAATREAAIISFLEKISGESLNLPTKAQFHSQLITEEESQQKDNNEDNAVEVYNADSANTNNNNNSGGGGLMQFNSSRWPKAEVQALIRVRSGFEAKFQEPGLKGPLWEEVSLAMAAMGYQRSAKRCKEKWENINKYFRKTKDSGKKRPQHSKTCPYFHQLDQLYSKTPSMSNADHGRKEKNSELLDAIVVSNDQAKRNEEGNEEEGQGESQDQEENADDDDGDRSPVRMERNQEHNSSDHRLLSRLNS